MRNAWLIVNGYLEGEKFEEIYQWLIDAAEKKGFRLKKLTNDRLTSVLPISSVETNWKIRPEFVLFWDKDTVLAKMLEKEGFLVFNNAEAIEICDDKALTFLTLKNSGVKMPKTFTAPLTFDLEYKDYAFLMQVENSLGYPMVIKENKGSFGQQVYLVQNSVEAIDIIKKIGSCNFIMQEYIKSSKGRDLRIHVVGNRIVTAMERKNNTDFRANITNGGTMNQYEPGEKECQMALNVCRLLKLDFAGVDLLFGENNEPVLCEVNSNAHFKNIYDCTGVNVADAMMEHIVNCVDTEKMKQSVNKRNIVQTEGSNS